MASYEQIRQHYRPQQIKGLLIAESPPPAANIASSRHFYRTDQIRHGDRLFVNTIKALYSTANDLSEPILQQNKTKWLKQFQADGWYMIEALDKSLPHQITPAERQSLIKQNLPKLVAKIYKLVAANTKIILIKSNVFIAAGPGLRQAGFKVINSELVDYPGQYNQSAYRQKLARLAEQIS